MRIKTTLGVKNCYSHAGRPSASSIFPIPEVVIIEEQIVTYLCIGGHDILSIYWMLNGSTIDSVDYSGESTGYSITSRANISLSMSGSTLECCLVHVNDASKHQCYATVVGK